MDTNQPCMKRLPENVFPGGYCGRCLGNGRRCPLELYEQDSVELPSSITTADEFIDWVKSQPDTNERINTPTLDGGGIHNPIVKSPNVADHVPARDVGK